jgi:3-methyladenine DNA glycosylase AlkC
MPERLKELFFNNESINTFADTIKRFYSQFDKKRFVDLVFDNDWGKRELKEKMRHTTLCLHETLPKPFNEALEILKKAAPYIKGFEAMTLPDYIEVYGIDDWELSLPALGHFTKYASSEFAVRPFLHQDPERVMELMNAWAEDKNAKVRRLASEGCRPRLPWAMALPKFKKDPGLILPILEKLKNDESETVRRSVANNLNDISKDHPQLVLDICEKWYGKNKHTDAVIKHACRTMLKAGDKRALMLFGYGNPASIQLSQLKLDKKELFIGDDLHASFELTIKENKACKVRLEYGVYFMKANGKWSRKVFKIAENTYKPGKHTFSRKHSFMDMSTRQHYPGTHQISIIVNGEELGKTSFELKKG